MATKSIAWNTGNGNITLTYQGQGDGPISIQSDANNLDVPRSQQVTVKTTKGGLITKKFTIAQDACPVNFRTFEGDIIKTADGDYFNVREMSN